MKETPSAGHLRLLTKVARMYHERGLRQPQIAEQLRISQPRVSRMLKQAVQLGIVRTVVVPPDDLHTDLEHAIEQQYGVRDVVLVDADDDENVIPALAGTAAGYLESTMVGGDRVGISSWSYTLLATVEAMHSLSRGAEEVVQILGGVGNPMAQLQATRLTGRLAELAGAEPRFLPAPGLVVGASARRALVKERSVADVAAAWDRLTLVLVGIGSLEPSPLLKESGNAIAQEEQEELRGMGAVGDICLRFFDAAGKPVKSQLDTRVLGITTAQLRKVPRRIGVAGGQRKASAIRAALQGGWLDVLITDLGVGQRLVGE